MKKFLVKNEEQKTLQHKIIEKIRRNVRKTIKIKMLRKKKKNSQLKKNKIEKERN